MFLAHRDAGRTSDDASNCGSDVDLAIGLAAMQKLVSVDAQPLHWYFVGSRRARSARRAVPPRPGRDHAVTAHTGGSW